MGTNIKIYLSQEILDIFLAKICIFQSIRANQSSISVKYAPKECKKKGIRRVYNLWIYRCLKQSTFHYQLTFICMYWSLGEKWKAKEKPEAVWTLVLLFFHGHILLWRHNFPRRSINEIVKNRQGSVNLFSNLCELSYQAVRI